MQKSKTRQAALEFQLMTMKSHHLQGGEIGQSSQYFWYSASQIVIGNFHVNIENY